MFKCTNLYEVKFDMPYWITNKFGSKKAECAIDLADSIFKRESTYFLDNQSYNEVRELLYLAHYLNPLTFDLRHVNYSEQDAILHLDYFEDHRKQVYSRVHELYDNLGIWTCKSELEVEKRVNDYLVEHCVWNDEGDYHRQHTLLGILLDGRGVCISFAQTVTMLLRCFGVKCYTVKGVVSDTPYGRGNGLGHYLDKILDPINQSKDDKITDGISYETHAWNVVFLDGCERHLDTTFNHSSEGQPWYSSIHKYFNLTTEEICRERDIIIGPSVDKI